jgi:hypothetical protein
MTVLLNALRVAAVLLTAIGMAAGWAHLLALPNKIALPRPDYLTVQQICRGWALLGIAVVGALVSTLALAILERGKGSVFYLSLAATLCIAASLAVFFLYTYPANQQTSNWTVLPENWEQLRRQWEYSHATGAGLYFLALFALTLSLTVQHD